MPQMDNKKKIMVYNALFLLFCAGLFLFLWSAPPETTARLPNNENHARFISMGKKQAEKFCTECHGEEGVHPLPEDHPPKYRCLFCHKQQQQ